MHERDWREMQIPIPIDDAENLTTEDLEYIPELAMEDEDRGRGGDTYR
jgi:hypothetical protein